MDDRTLAALRASISKWEAIVAGTGGDRGGSNCAPCKAFFKLVDGDSQCEGCPVRAQTGQPDCYGSPYYLFRDAATLTARGA